MLFRKLALAAATALCCTIAAAEVKPSALLSDHMVLQRGRSVPIWGTANPGEKVTVDFDGQHRSAVTSADGRWQIHLRNLHAGGPYEMTIAGDNSITINDVYVGEVWIASGQSNMSFTVSKKRASYAGMLNEDEEIARARYPQIRMFTVKYRKSDTPKTDVQGDWEVCSPETVPGFSAVGYLFARDLHKALHVPVGIVTVAYGASTAQAWLPRAAMASDPELKPMLDQFDALESWYRAHPNGSSADAPAAPQTLNARPRKPGPLRDPVQDQHEPTVLFNGMLNPVIPYAMRGVLWYQGESIVGGRHGVELYPHLMATLVTEWRKLWGEGKFPFLEVQLAALDNISNNPVVREDQARLLSLPNTGMAVTIDIGDRTNVHPKNKEPLGERLTRIALAKAYGQHIEYSGPVYESMDVEGSSIRLKFSHVGGGLVARGGPLKWFQIAAADQKFVDADAEIKGDTIIVRSSQVDHPVAVRYAWADYPEGCNLYNAAGLPAAPFRTDKWDALTPIAAQFTGR